MTTSPDSTSNPAADIPDDVGNLTSKLTQKVDSLRQYTIGLSRSVKLLRLVGYSFLILYFFDLVALIVPPNFTNPVWEFGLMGQLVERVAIPILGFAFVFMAESEGRTKWENLIVKVLSWLALLFAVFYFVLMVLGISSTVRVDRQNKQQLTSRVNQTKDQIQQLQERLDGIKTIEDMEALLGQIDQRGRTPDIKDDKQFKEVKDRFTSFLSRNERQLKIQATSTQSTQRRNLFKQSVKWNLGALVSTALFFSLWRGTGWARRRR